jgi:hypothetical protein
MKDKKRQWKTMKDNERQKTKQKNTDDEQYQQIGHIKNERKLK